MLVGFGFKVAAVPFHQWAPDAYEGAPAPVTAWIATGSKMASFVALMKVFLHALQPWSHPSNELMGPGWLGVIAVVSAVTMTYGNFAALAQRNFKRMLAYSSIAHAGYMLVGVAAASVSTQRAEAAGSVLFYLVVYAFANVGAFAVAAWLVRDKKTDDIDDLNGLGMQSPGPGDLHPGPDALADRHPPVRRVLRQALHVHGSPEPEALGTRLTLIGLVALGLFNSVVSAFYYVRVLKAMFLREPGSGGRGSRPAGVDRDPDRRRRRWSSSSSASSPGRWCSVMRAASVPMLTATGGGFASMISARRRVRLSPLPGEIRRPGAGTRPRPSRRRRR